MKKRYAAILLLCVLLQYAKGQSPYAVPNILPPSPNAAALGKYGGVQTGLASGSINKTIPVYEYNSRSIKLPISIDYTSSGLKVDEIASRTGQGWALNAGGVITRTVNGTVDDFAMRMVPPDNFISTWTKPQKVAFLEQMVGGDELFQGGVGPYGTVDGQPDMFNFNFNGYSGQFILDTLRNPSTGGLFYGQPVLLSHSGLKILRNSEGSAFRAITPDGVQYLFNETEFTSSVTSSPTDQFITCNTNYSQPVATGWYLSKIIHPNRDTVSFTYQHITTSYATGISETIYAIGPRTSSSTECLPGAATILPNTSCENVLTTSGSYLDEINSTTGGKVKFNYMARTDYNDQLVSSIAVYAPGGPSPLKTFSFTYEYAGGRPFLRNFVEKDETLTAAKTHRFRYKDLPNVPQRLSYSQDHWGYYNGAGNNTMIPVPIGVDFKQNLPLATANREPNYLYAMKGLLSSVIYPTGGKDSIEYEGNQAYQMVTTGPTSSVISAETNGSTWPGLTYSATATLSFEQLVNLYAYCNSNLTEDDDLKQTQYTIRNGSNTVVYAKTLKYNQSVNENIVLPAGTYTIEISVYGVNITGGGTMAYLSGVQQTQYQNANTGGIRVARVLTYESLTGVPQVKKYRYQILNDPNISSGAPVPRPSYEKLLRTYYTCPTDCGLLETDYYSMYSNSLDNVYTYSSNPTTYVNVIESFGDNDENGRVEHAFTVSPDVPAYSYLGELLRGGIPVTSNSAVNGRETYQGVYKKTGSSLVPVKQVYTHYNMNPSVNGIPFYKSTWGGVANRRYAIPVSCQTVLFPLDINDKKLASYDLMMYSVNHYWFYVDSVLTRTYDAGGQNYVDQVTLTKYSDPSHALPTSVVNYKSNQETLITNYTYPSNYSIAPYPDMVARHILSPVIEQTDYKGTAFMNATRTNYYSPFPGIYVPQTVESKIGSITDPYDTRLRFHAYNDIGNMLSVSKENGSKISYVWSYNGKYPVAKIENADYNTVQTTLGGQSTLRNFLNNNPADSVVKSFLTPSRTLPEVMVTTYTYRPLIGVTSMIDPKGMASYYDYDGFQRLENIRDQDKNIIKHFNYHYTDGTDNGGGTPTSYSNIAISQSFTRNDCPAGAFGGVAVYTVPAGRYTSSISQADADAQASSDITSNGQAYANANATCSTTAVYYNVALSQSFTKNDCPAGTLGGTAVYTVPAARYTSSISQADADAQASSDVTSNGQAYANANATCSSTAVYYNVVLSQSFTKNDCASGGTPGSYTYTVAGGSYSSTISQGDADAQAQNAINANGQAAANANAVCTYSNVALSQSFTKNDCGPGGTPGSYTYTVAAGSYSSTTSQADADAQAQNVINANGQAAANVNAVCTYYNVTLSQTFTKEGCGTGIPDTYVYTVNAGNYSSTISQADANAQAQNVINANGQNTANSNAGCTFYSEEISQVYRRQCDNFANGSLYTYVVIAGKYVSRSSQADANSQAASDQSTNGQNMANLNGTCDCVGQWTKFVNGACEIGRRVTTSSVPETPFNYICTYHYEWSDGSRTINYTESSPFECVDP